MHPLRARREALGLSQAGLAAAAGVTRALVAGIEGGRHVPGVTAALALARALGVSVEELFDGGRAPALPVALAGTLADGDIVVAARVGELLVAAPAGGRGAEPGWAEPTGALVDGALAPFPGARLDGLVVAGCDPALGIAAAMLAAGERRVVALHASSGDALAALGAGRAHAAVIHGPVDALPAAAAGDLRVVVAAWAVGVAADTATGDLVAEALAGRLGLVQREGSAASQQALARAAAAHGVALPAARALGRGHADAARAAELLRCGAVTYEPAAAAHGLRFAPLEHHRVELRVDRRHVGHPAVAALVDVLGGAGFRRRVGAIGGYDLALAGSVVGEAA